jgi:hypothetical protein
MLIACETNAKRKVERQIKVLIKHLDIFFLFPSKKFLRNSKIQLLETSPQKIRNKDKVARCLFF